MTEAVPTPRLKLRLRGKGLVLSSGDEIEVETRLLTPWEACCVSPGRPQVGDSLSMRLEWPLASEGAFPLEGTGIVNKSARRGDGTCEFEVKFRDCPRLRDGSGEGGGRIPPILQAPGVRRQAFLYYRRLERVRDFVLGHYTESIPLERAAQVAGMEESYFSDFFSRKVGLPFTRWLSHLRVARAIEMIQESNDSITFIAHEVGFPTLRTFERAFRRQTGITPARYRRLARPA